MNQITQPSDPDRMDPAQEVAKNEEIASLSSREVFSEQSVEEGIKMLPQHLRSLIELADQLVRQGIGYRRYKRDRTLSLRNLARPKRRLSCSEFIWYLLSLSGHKMGEAPVSSKRMAFRRRVYPESLEKISAAEIQLGDILVYSHPKEALKRQRELLGESQVGHVVLVVSRQPKIVVGSHGLESTPEGEPTGLGYRRLLLGWEQWTKRRPLQAVYRIRAIKHREA